MATHSLPQNNDTLSPDSNEHDSLNVFIARPLAS